MGFFFIIRFVGLCLLYNLFEKCIIVFPLVGEGQHPGLHRTHEENVIGTCKIRVV